jgi:isopentenyldiphosphate isomerase
MKTIQKETENNEIDEIQEIEEKSAPLPKRTEVIASDKVDQEEMLNDDAIKYCPYSVFCLRYYRIQDGDELEKIAERFSATVAKLKEYNALEDNHLKSGRLIRIP